VAKRHYRAVLHRTFREAVVHLLESEYKLVGSHRVIQMIADDIANLHEEYYQDASHVPPGHIVWRAALDPGRKPPVNQTAAEQPTVSAILPLITPEEIAERVEGCPPGKDRRVWFRERDTRRIVRLVKAALNNPNGRQLLTLADLSLLINRSIPVVRRCIREHFERTGELIPTKGFILDQGSNPTHKAIILRLYEEGKAPPDIARTTEHSLEAVDRYIKDYERVKVLLGEGLTVREISLVIDRGESTVLQYYKLACAFHPDLASATAERVA
jgi:DNA-binding NarL/FixJ family response regulator